MVLSKLDLGIYLIYTKPTDIIPVVKPDTPSFRYTEAIGAIKAKELPKYTGDLPLVQKIYI